MPESTGEDALVERLVRAVGRGEQVTLLVGSGVSALAVPRLARMLEHAERYAAGVGDDGDLSDALAQARAEQGPDARVLDVYVAYRKVFADWVSPFEFDVVAQQAVLDAYRPPDLFDSPLAAHGIWQRVDLRLGEHVENSTEWWDLPPGVEALGRLLATRPNEFGNRLLTTNFDPLVEVAVRGAEGRAVSIPVDPHGSAPVPAGTEGSIRVYHLHGFWRPSLRMGGPGLLHDPGALTHPARRMVRAVADLITGDVVCAVGYGGWDDAVVGALREVARLRPVELLWALHGEEPERTGAVEERAKLAGAVTFFPGVDADRLFPRLAQRLDVPMISRGGDARRRFRHPAWERELLSAPGNTPPDDILRLLRQLDQRYGWGLEWADRPQAPTLVFWPIRLRSRPSVIHAVQAFGAGALSERGARVVVCLDDFGVTQRAEYTERFRHELLRWLRRIHPDADPQFSSLQDFIEDPDRPAGGGDLATLRRPVDPWQVARAFYGSHNPSVYSLLAGLKVVPNLALRELSDEAKAKEIVQALLRKDANRLLTPLTQWSLLHQVLRTENADHVMTLGGRNEGFLWGLYREAFDLNVNHLYNPYIKSLTNESLMVRWSSVDELRRHLQRAYERGGWREHEGHYIPWLVQNALLLPIYLAREDFPDLGGYRLDSWAGFAAALEAGLPVLDLLAERVSQFYLGEQQG
ncbi:SIR2 family protein [Rhizomonospora bruguierae]|uniref:SIR2 family protein n=1 Tax=Rhizomonospora bruguierae TaxID=1581705 RepID=UPI001BCE760E|nr:SIR2 family protein [Micromonospora sp. NBRC 107566]